MTEDITLDITTENINVTAYSYKDYDPETMYKSPFGITRLSMCAAGLLLNFCTMLACAHVPQGITNHIKLILSLAISDSLICLSLPFLNLHHLLPNKPACMTYWSLQILNVSILATLLNLVGMAIDLNITIMASFRYPQIMTAFRGNCVVFLIWFISITLGSLDALVAISMPFTYDTQTFCDKATSDHFDSELPTLGITLVVFTIMMIVYVRIYLLVRKKIRDRHTLTQDETQSYKAVVTTFLILGTFIVCWIPHCIYQIVMNILVHTNIHFMIKHQATTDLIDEILFTFLVSNSISDPIIYAARLGKVQNGYKRMLLKYFPRYRHYMNERNFRTLNNTGRSQRRCTSATLLDHETNDHCKRQHKISDPEITVIPLNSSSSPDINEESETIKLVEYSHRDDGSNGNKIWPDDDATAPEHKNVRNRVNKETERTETREEIQRGGTEEDPKSNTTNVTPVSTISDKDFWSDTEVSNLLSSRISR